MAYTTIKKPTDYFNTVLYEGNGATGRGITGVGHQPDFVWIKNRDATTPHVLTDAVRGATVTLNSNDTSADDTISNGLTAFGTDGFTIGGNGSFNYSNESFVSWNWKANGAGSANTDGTISSTVSSNTTSGFSIVKYTGNATSGATVGHGLGVTPKVIIIKGLGTTYNWIFGHNSLSTNWTNYLTLSTTDASAAATNIFNDTAPTSSVFSIGNALGVNTNSSDYIAYCLAEKTGYSKFGSYTGNGNADGTFVYTGFKPAFVMVKRTDNTNHFAMYDNKRNGFNDENNYLRAEGTYAEGSETWGDLDILSNGFKPKANDGMHNASGGTYIYMAFAEAPLVGSNNVPCTAR